MAHVSVIGTGSMGQAIAGVVAKGGHAVQLLGTGDSATAVTGDIVVLAVPYGAIDAVLAERGDSLAGRIVVDITNPVNFETFDSLTVARGQLRHRPHRRATPERTGAEGLQHDLRRHAGRRHRRPADHDRPHRRRRRRRQVDPRRDHHLRRPPGDRRRWPLACPRARGLGFLQITLAAAEKVAWTGGFGIVA